MARRGVGIRNWLPAIPKLPNPHKILWLLLLMEWTPILLHIPYPLVVGGITCFHVFVVTHILLWRHYIVEDDLDGRDKIVCILLAGGTVLSLFLGWHTDADCAYGVLLCLTLVIFGATGVMKLVCWATQQGYVGPRYPMHSDYQNKVVMIRDYIRQPRSWASGISS